MSSNNPGEPIEQDKYEHYNYEQDKLTGHGGKGRTKKESDQKKKQDPSKKAPGMVKKGEEKRKSDAIGKQ